MTLYVKRHIKLRQAHTDQQADCCSCNSYLLRCFLAFAQQNDPSTTYIRCLCVPKQKYDGARAVGAGGPGAEVGGPS